MPVSGEAESSNKRMTGSKTGENEHSNNVPGSFERTFTNLQKLDIDFSPVKVRVEEIFKMAYKFDELRSTISEKMSGESQGMPLSTAKDELKNAQDEVARLKKDLLEQHQTFKASEDSEAELERELELVRATKEDCDTSITKMMKDLGTAKTIVSEAVTPQFSHLGFITKSLIIHCGSI
nr:hypothetical protein Iba_chr08eCG5820 [Ipomoea batatas]